MNLKLYELLIEKYSLKFNLDKKLILAIIETESSYNQWAMRYEPNYRWLYSPKELSDLVGCTRKTMEVWQKSSYGLMQIMGANAYELGFRSWAPKLFDVGTNILYGCEFVKRIVDKGITNPIDIYDVYNSGKVDHTDGNKKNVERFTVIYNRIIQHHTGQ